jgi:type VI secretion system protein ImpE
MTTTLHPANAAADPADLLRQAQPAAALAALTDQVRKRPADFKLRVFLAQLLCVLGQWERALNQLDVAAELDALAVPMKQVYGDAVRGEHLRADVFAGRRTPMVFGQPDAWLALLIESMLRRGRGHAGDAEAAEELRARAFEAAPVSTGRIDGTPFAWLADADMRLGPVLEAYIHGRYYWVPFARLARIRIEPPEDLRDAVWMPAHLDFENGGESLALIPTRYQGSERSADGALQLARKTEWRELAPEVWAGSGQRVFGSDDGDYALMDVRDIVFDPPPARAADAEEEDGGGGAHG